MSRSLSITHVLILILIRPVHVHENPPIKNLKSPIPALSFPKILFPPPLLGLHFGIMKLGLIEPLHPTQRESLRRMSPPQKWLLAQGLLATATQLRRQALTRLHPAWSPRRLEKALADERIACSA